MPNKLTDAEVKKAFECCIKSSHFGECFENECPLVSEKGCKVGKETLYPYVLDLINRLEHRIHQQEKTIMEIQNANLIDFKGTIANYKSENESLKAEVERLKAKANHYNYCYENFVNTPISRIKAEAYKEFAERLREKGYFPRLSITKVVSIEDIDNLLNELVGDDNSHNIDKQN